MRSAYALGRRGLWAEALIDDDDRERLRMIRARPELRINGR
jgi:hypothetical protein